MGEGGINRVIPGLYHARLAAQSRGDIMHENGGQRGCRANVGLRRATDDGAPQRRRRVLGRLNQKVTLIRTLSV